MKKLIGLLIVIIMASMVNALPKSLIKPRKVLPRGHYGQTFNLRTWFDSYHFKVNHKLMKGGQNVKGRTLR